MYPISSTLFKINLDIVPRIGLRNTNMWRYKSKIIYIIYWWLFKMGIENEL